MSPHVPDHALRLAAIEHVRALDARYRQLVPVAVLRKGFPFGGRRVSLGSFYSGIFRPRELRGPAALAVVTTPPAPGKARPYEDDVDPEGGAFTYHYRDARKDSAAARAAAERDNAALRAAHEQQVPLIWFVGQFPGMYTPLAPVFVSVDDPARRVVELLMGIDPDCVVHVAHRLLEEVDGAMLREGLQGFHGRGIVLPRRAAQRPDPARLEIRFGEFERAAA